MTAEQLAQEIACLTTDMLAPYASRIRHRTPGIVPALWFGALGEPDSDEWRAVVSDALLDELRRRELAG